MEEIGKAYRGCRERITQLVTNLDEERAASAVPACPGWTVHDVVAHLSGGIADALAGRLDGASTDPWTAAQVDARRGVPLPAIVAEWSDNAPQVEPLMDGAGVIGRQAVTDIVSHEHDIRGALRLPGARDSDAVDVALGFAASQVLDSARQHGVSLRIQITDGAAFGPGAVDTVGALDAVLTGDRFDLLRAMTGRRSVEQLRAMKWEGDVEAALPGFSWLTLRPAASSIED